MRCWQGKAWRLGGALAAAFLLLVTGQLWAQQQMPEKGKMTQEEYEKALAQWRADSARLARQQQEAQLLAEAKRNYNEGNALLKKGDYEAAIEKYKRALELDSTMAKAWYGIGLANRNLRRSEEAIAAYRKAIQLDPKYGDAIFALGKLLSDLDRSQEALKVYQDAVQADPNLAKAYYEMGRIYLENKQYQEAVSAFTRATQIDPQYSLAYTSLGAAYHQLGKYQEAVNALENAVAFDPENYLAYYRLAEVYNAMGQHERALENATKSLELRKQRFAPAAYEAGRAAAALGKTQEAIEYYRLAARDSRWKSVAEYELNRLQGNR
ncbi:MAG: tetratricopeptide repeat protein [candidate division KSB1 bacterium]|nr:tetratricopeptide repeat protein [candidate division KSB1 bacterium]